MKQSEVFLMPGYQKPHVLIGIDVKDWSTPYLRIGRHSDMNFIAVQILCLAISVYW